jgi:hypothetical protein
MLKGEVLYAVQYCKGLALPRISNYPLKATDF